MMDFISTKYFWGNITEIQLRCYVFCHNQHGKHWIIPNNTILKNNLYQRDIFLVWLMLITNNYQEWSISIVYNIIIYLKKKTKIVSNDIMIYF